MGIMDGLLTDVKGIIEYGSQIRIRHFTGSVATTGWDDNQTLTKSGNDVWTSGLIFPVGAGRSSYNAVLLEQGKIKTDDKVCFVAGDVETTSIMKIGTGSPVTQEHSILPEGIIAMPSVGTCVYKKMYMRNLPLGSFVGEM